MVERVKEPQRARVGTVEELQAKGCLAGKVGSQPVCVFWSDGEAFAVDDRCPHMGFPLHRGTVENGLLTRPATTFAGFPRASSRASPLSLPKRCSA